MSVPQPEWPAHPPAVWPTKQHSPYAQSLKALPVTSMDGLTDRTAKRASLSSLSLNRFSLHKGASKSQEQPPPLPTKASVAPRRKLGKKPTNTGGLGAVYGRSSEAEEMVDKSSRSTRSAKRVTHFVGSPQIQHPNPTHFPTSTAFSLLPPIKSQRSFFKRMTDRLTRSRSSLQEHYKEDEPRDSRGEQSTTFGVDQIIGTSVIKIPASPSSPSLFQTSHSPAPVSPRHSHPPLPSQHQRPTQPVPPTPTAQYPPSSTPLLLRQPASPNPSTLVASTILSSKYNTTNTRKSRLAAIQIPRGDMEHATTTWEVPDYNLIISANSSQFPRDITATPRSSVVTLGPTTLVSTHDTRDPLPLSFPLPPVSPPVNIQSPRKSCISPSNSLASSHSPTVRRTSSAHVCASLGSPITPRRKAESVRGREAMDKGLNIPRGWPIPLERTQLVQEMNRLVPPPHMSSHVRADSDTLADIDLQMVMEAHKQTTLQPTDLVFERQTPPLHSDSLSLAEARARQRIQNHLLMLPAEGEGMERADSPTIPGVAMCIGEIEQAVHSSDQAQSGHQLSHVKPLNSRCNVNLSNASISHVVQTPVGSSLHNEGHLRDNRWLAGSPTDTEKSVCTTASLDPCPGTMVDGNVEEIVPVTEHVALEIAERAANSILMRKGEEARKRRSLFSRKDRRVVSVVSSM